MTLMLGHRPPEVPARGLLPGIAKSAGRFTVHVLGMCLAMCLSLGLFGVAAAAAGAALGVGDVEQQFPALSAMLVAAVFALVMVGWMRLMRMDWRPTLEMSGVALVAGVLMVVANQFGLVSDGSVVGGVCGLACAAMILLMLVRFRLYAGHAHAGDNGSYART